MVEASLRSRGSMGPVPLVGRQEDVESLVRAFEDAIAEAPRLVFIAGEAGVGKTRLLTEAAAYAGSHDWQVLLGHAYDSRGMPPYLPFLEGIAAYARSERGGGALARLGAAAPEIALLIPELGGVVHAPIQRSSVGPEADRYRLFEGMAAFFESVAREAGRGLLLCLEDLHWADESSLLLLEHIARRPHGAPLVIAASFRDAPLDPTSPLARTLARMKRERLAAHMQLKGLDRDAVAALLAALGGPNPPPLLVDSIFGQTEGNPFFLLEVFDDLKRRGRVFDEAGNWQAAPLLDERDVPQSVLLAVEHRLEGIGPQCRSVLAIAAMIGRIIDYDLLRAVAEVDDEALLAATDEAERAGLLAMGPSADPAFAHELIRRTLLNGIPSVRLQRLHLRAAEAIERLDRDGPGQRLGRVAEHFRQAGSAAHPKAIEYSIRAGEEAERALAYEGALVHWEAALELMERHGVRGAARAGLVERLGELMQVVGFDNYGRGAAYFEQAISLHDQARSPADAARVHARLALLLAAGGPINDNPRALRHLSLAEPLLRDGPPDDAQLSFFSALGLLAVWRVRTGEGLADSRRAMEVARALGREDRWVTNAVMQSYHLQAEGKLREGFALLEEAWNTADALNNTYRAFVASTWTGGRLAELGDPVAAQPWYRRELDQPRQLEAPSRQRGLALGFALALGQAGDLDACRALLEEWGVPPPPALQFWDGAWDEAATTWTRAREAASANENRSVHANLGWRLARLHALRGDSATAIGLLSDALRIGLDGPHALTQLLASSELALILARDGDPGAAEPHLDRACDIAAAGEDWRGLGVRLTLARAAMATARGESDEAEYQLAAALDGFRRLSLPWDEAEALELWAHIGQRFHRGRAREAFVAETLESAREIYRRIGAGQPWLDRLDAIAGANGTRRDGAQLPDGLTTREVEVLRLLAAGCSNAEIASELVLSVRTVERHITTLYGKIGSSGRAAAAAYAIRHSLVED